MTPLEIETTAFRIVAQCPNQLRNHHLEGGFIQQLKMENNLTCTDY